LNEKASVIKNKKCTQCKKSKPLKDFYIDRRNKDERFSACKDCVKIVRREYYYNNIEKCKISVIDYYRRNTQKIRDRGKRYYQTNRESIREYQKQYSKKQKEKQRCRRRWHKQMLDPGFRLGHSISTQIYHALKRKKGGWSWEQLVGYTLGDLMKHLENKFQDNMTWENYGQWHIDHIIPISAFNFKSPVDIDFKKCWALTNLQPLWAVDNLRKGATL